MRPEIRNTGIKLIETVPWGTHLCVFYASKKDLLEILVPYFKSGLENNEFCVWVTSQPLKAQEAKEAMRKAMPDFNSCLKKGQIEIIPHTQWYLKGGSFNQERVLNGWVAKLNQAGKKGYAGLRLTGNTFWLEKKDWDEFTNYEGTVNNVIGKYKMLAICTYPLEKRGPFEMIDVIRNHRFSFIHRAGKWEILESSVMEAAAGIAATALERKRAQEALRQSEERMNRSQEIAHLGSWEYDIANNRLSWSDEVYRIFGLKPQEFGATYEAFLEAVHPDDRKAVSAAYSHSLREGRDTYEIEHRVVRKSSGEVRIVHEKCQNIRDESGRIIRSAGMVHDITERKKSEEKINRIASFPQLNPNPVIELDANGKVIFSNLAAIKTLKRLNAAKQIKLFLPDDFAQILQAFNSTKTQEFTREVQIRDSFFIETLVVMPELNLARIYARDITARKLAEERLRKVYEELELKVNQRTEELVEANKQLNQEIFERQAVEKRIRLSNAILKLFEKAASRKEYLEKVVKLIRSLSRCRCAGIRVLDGEGNIPYESYVGFSREFWEAENRLSVVCDQCACIRVMTARPGPEDREAMTKSGSFRLDNSSNFMAGLTEKGKGKFRNACVKNGFLSIAVIPMRYKGRVIAGVHLADEKEKKLPLQLVESIESVTDLIGEGIYKFTLLEEIQKSNELLERAKRLSDIGSLAATVAHELRNPLGVIRTAAYNVKRKARNPLLDGHLANIEKKILEADQIINNLLFYSRLKAPHIERVRFFDILKDCVESLKDKYTDCAGSISTRISLIKEEEIEADPLQLGELFNNILGNAHDAFIENRGRIEVSARKDDSGNIIAQVRDYGIGMDTGQLKRIFEPFYTTKAKGTGLGLSVCKQITTLHNGRIEFESEKGKGTTVTVTLPLRRESAPANLNR